MKFIVASFKALRELHPREDLEIALGADTLATLEKEQDEVDALTQKMKEIGTVIEGAGETSAPADTEAAAIETARAEAAARACAEAEAAAKAKAEALARAEAEAAEATLSKGSLPEVPPPSEPPVRLATLSYPQLRAIIKAKGGEEPPMSCNKQGLVVRAQQSLRGEEFISQEQLNAIVGDDGRSGANRTKAMDAPRRFSFGGGGEKCDLCKKTVYPAERLTINGLVFHQGCFRCAKCNTKLHISSYELDPANTPYCKTHFAQEWSRRSMGAATSMGAETLGTSATPFALLGNANHCSRCGKRVYANEMMRTERRNAQSDAQCWHMQCFKCKDCGTKLRPDSYEEAPNGDLVCKTHYVARRNAAELEAPGVP